MFLYAVFSGFELVEAERVDLVLFLSLLLSGFGSQS